MLGRVPVSKLQGLRILWGKVARKRQWHCHGKPGRVCCASVPWHAQSGEQALNSARVESSSIDSMPEKCSNSCAQESKVRTGRFLRGKLISAHFLFLATTADKEPQTGKILEAFSGDEQGFGPLHAGSHARRLQSSKASTDMDLGKKILYLCTTRTKQTDWSVIYSRRC